MADPAPAYLVKGDDPTLVAQALRTVLEEVTSGDPTGLGVEDHTADEPDIGAVVDALMTPPFLVDRRTVVLRDLSGLRSDDVDRLVAYLAAPGDTTVLVMGSTGRVPNRLADAVKKVGHIVDAAVPTGKARSSWLSARLRQAPVHVDGPAAALIGDHLGEDLGRLAGLLDALAASYGEGAHVGVAEVEPFLGEAGATAPWELTDAIDAGDVAGSLGALRRLTGPGGRHPLVVMATLHRHYAGMLALDGSDVRSDADAASRLGMRSAFPAGKIRAQGARLGSRGIARAIVLLARADLDLRGGTAVPEDAVMDILVARLARLSPSRRARQAPATTGRRRR
ncbi:MAG TPA: DNA polymerase III subunit delta [Acidimicrobiales bacterium]|nr:DNA polymerase III subunit delta [Acidimicrobiales bacterium]